MSMEKLRRRCGLKEKANLSVQDERKEDSEFRGGH